MPIEYGWYNNEERILLIHIKGSWTVDDYYQMVEGSRDISNHLTTPFVVIVDLTHGSTPPSKLLTVARYSSQNIVNPVTNIFVNPGKFMEMLLSIYRKMFPRGLINPQVVFSMPDALQLAEEALEKATHDTTDS